MGGGCIISLPGVPRELDHMMENTVIPLLIERMGGIKVTRVRVLRTCAVGESNIDRGIGDLMTEGQSDRWTGSAYRSRLTCGLLQRRTRKKKQIRSSLGWKKNSVTGWGWPFMVWGR